MLQTRRTEIRAQRLGTQRCKRRPKIARYRLDQINRSESAWVAKRQHAPAIGFENEMVVYPDLTRIHAPATRHAEVKDHAIAAVGLDDAVFRAPRQTGYARAGHPLAKIDGDRTTQVGAADIDAHQDRAEQGRLQPADSCFDFGKFGHKTG